MIPTMHRHLCLIIIFIMSIYSGFATRQQEQTYDDCLDSIIFILQKRILKFYQGEHADQHKFMNFLMQKYSQLKYMETHKYLQPKYSSNLDQLMAYLSMKNNVNGKSSQNLINASQFRIKRVVKESVGEGDGRTNNAEENCYGTRTGSKGRIRNNSCSIPQRKPFSFSNVIEGVDNWQFLAHPQLGQPQTAQTELAGQRCKQNPHEVVFSCQNKRQQRLFSSKNISRSTQRKKSTNMRSGAKIRKQEVQHQSIGQEVSAGSQNDQNQEVRELIRGYISRSRKESRRDLQRKKLETDSLSPKQ